MYDVLFFLYAGINILQGLWKKMTSLLNQNITPFWNLNPKLINRISLLVTKPSLLEFIVNHTNYWEKNIFALKQDLNWEWRVQGSETVGFLIY